mgnify:CR=1 FL=1
MIAILVLIGLIFLTLFIMYYIDIIFEFDMNEYKYKKDLINDLVPFRRWYVKWRKKFDDLE